MSTSFHGCVLLIIEAQAIMRLFQTTFGKNYMLPNIFSPFIPLLGALPHSQMAILSSLSLQLDIVL